MAMRMWFWSSGLVPLPKRGASAAVQGAQPDAWQPISAALSHTSKGLANVAIRPKKNSEMTPSTDSAPAPNSSDSFFSTLRKTPNVNPASTNPHSTMEPSRAAHPEAIVKISGVPAL